jgi:hypothetical protein
MAISPSQINNGVYTPIIANTVAKSLTLDENQREIIFNETPGGANFCYLLSQGIVDSDGMLTPDVKNTPLPRLERLILEALNALLNSKIASDTDITVKKLLKHLTRDPDKPAKIEIVGGYLRRLILSHPEFIREALEEIVDSTPLNISPPLHKTPDCDIRTSFLETDETEIDNMGVELYEFVKKNMGSAFNEEKVIEKKNFLHFDGANQYGIITFKGPDDLNFEFLIIKGLKRKSLFLHDALRLTINSLIKETSGTIMLVSDYDLQPIIDFLTGIIHINNPEEIDHLGWPLLISYYTRGHTSCDIDAEKILLKKSNLSNLNQLLKICVRNHHQNDHAAEIALLFNASISLGSNNQAIWDLVSNSETLPEKNLLWGIKKLLKEDGVSFELLVSCMQIFALLHLHHPDNTVNLVRHHRENWVQIKIDKNHLLIPFEWEIALENIQKADTSHIFQMLYQVWTPSVESKEESQLKKYKEIFNDEMTRVEGEALETPVALTVRTVLHSLQPDSQLFMDICRILPEMNHPLRAYLLSLSEKTFSQSATLFKDAKKFPADESKTRWILSFAETQDPSLCKLAYQFYAKSKEKFGESFLIDFINKLMPRDPISALNVFHNLKKFDAAIFIKIASGLDNSVVGKVILDATCKEKVRQLVHSNLLQACQVMTHQHSPFYCDLWLTRDCLSMALLSQPENLHQYICQLVDILLVLTFVRQEFPGTGKEKSETWNLIDATLRKLREQNLYLTKVLIARLKNSFEKICSYCTEENKVEDFLNTIYLMRDLKVPFPNTTTQKEDLTHMIKKIRIHMKGRPEDSALFFLKIVPEVYGDGFTEPFSDEVYAISRNLAKKESSLNLSLELLKKYNIHNPKIWKTIIIGLVRSKADNLRVLALPLLLAQGKECDVELWFETFRTAPLHKYRRIFGMIDNFLNKDSQEHKVFRDLEMPVDDKLKVLYGLADLCLERLPANSPSTTHRNRVFALRALICQTGAHKPNIEFDIRVIEALLKLGQIDIISIIMQMITNEFYILKQPEWIERLYKIMIQVCQLLMKEDKSYEQIRLQFQYLEVVDDETDQFFRRILSFFDNITEVIENHKHPLTLELVTLATPMFIDFGRYDDSCISFKILNSQDYKENMNAKCFAFYWERFLETRFRMNFIVEKPIVYRNELKFFLDHQDKLPQGSEVRIRCFEYVVRHFCEFLLTEYNTSNDKLFIQPILQIFKEDDNILVNLIYSLINCNPDSHEKSAFICLTIYVNLLYLKKKNTVSEEVSNELFDSFIYMSCHSPEVDKVVLKDYINRIILKCIEENYFSQVKKVKWLLYHGLEKENYIEDKHIRNNYYQAMTEMLFDFQHMNRPEFLSFTLKIVKIVQSFLLSKESLQLEKGYQYFIDLFSTNPNLFVEYPLVVKELDKTLAELKKTSKKIKRMSHFNTIEGAWKKALQNK